VASKLPGCIVSPAVARLLASSQRRRSARATCHGVPSARNPEPSDGVDDSDGGRRHSPRAELESATLRTNSSSSSSNGCDVGVFIALRSGGDPSLLGTSKTWLINHMGVSAGAACRGKHPLTVVAA
jgi:hypothetical protein